MNTIINRSRYVVNRARYVVNKIKKTIISAPELKIQDFEEVRQLYNNNDPKSYCRIDIFDKSNNNNVGVIIYRLTTGQVCVFYIADNYRNQGLGTSIIKQTMFHMKHYGTQYIWVNTIKGDVFWDNVNINGRKFTWCEYGKLFNSSRDGTGYQMKIPT